uniref:Putative juvenile hormone-inducible protein n=1 Tax=Nyssomyia neivai TaxID=330878 RepID=A0A1L8DN05_9DIPT
MCSITDLNLTANDIKHICRRHLVRETSSYRKFHVNSCELNELGDGPVGFLAHHYILTVEISKKLVGYSDEKRSLSTQTVTFFVKVFPEASKEQAVYINEMKAFQKEIDLYSFLLPRLQDIGIGSKEWGAQSYLAKDDKVLVIENLKADGFELALNQEGSGVFDCDHVSVALDVLARFHASGIVLEDRSKMLPTQMYPDCFEENAYPEQETHIRMLGLKNAIHAHMELIKMIPKYQDNEKLSKILSEYPKVAMQIVDFVKTSQKFRNVVSHGDLWANNIMFKYEECGEDKKFLKPIDGRLVDFQLVRYAPPALDVVTLIFNTTDSVLRKEKLIILLDGYYKSLTKELARFGILAEDYLPWEDFLESIEYYKLAGLIESVLFGHLTKLPIDIANELLSSSVKFGDFIKSHARDMYCIRGFEMDYNYRTRLTDSFCQIIDDYIL